MTTRANGQHLLKDQMLEDQETAIHEILWDDMHWLLIFTPKALGQIMLMELSVMKMSQHNDQYPCHLHRYRTLSIQ